MKTERHIISILREIAAERRIKFETFSQDWIVRLSRAGAGMWVFGYDFDINSCVAQLLAEDKAGTSLMLAAAQVPHIEHVLFNHPQNLTFVPENGNWLEMRRYVEAAGWDVVVKPNDGSGGIAVARTTTPAELEDMVQKLFSKGRAIAISRYLQITDEFRVIVLDGRCLLVYRKIRPTLIGDGHSTRLELITTLLKSAGDGIAAAKALAELGRQKLDLGEVVPAGEHWPVSWKHNLALGSRVELISESGHSEGQPVVVELALRAASAINLRFGAVDVVEVNGALRVLEINAGVMMESFVGLVQRGPEIARRIYAEAVDAAIRR